MVTLYPLLENGRWCCSTQIGRESKSLSKCNCLWLKSTTLNSEDVSVPIIYRADKRQLRVTSSAENLFSRRPAILCTGVSLISTFTSGSGLIPPPVGAEEKNPKDQEDDGDNGVLGAIKSMFDPNEKTKSGKVLPKSYLKAAREVVKTLRESLEEDSKDVAKFRRTADAAKVSIREYLNGWRGQQAVKTEESYVALEKAIRSLASFYSKAGPFATLSEEAKNSILDDLSTAEANL